MEVNNKKFINDFCVCVFLFLYSTVSYIKIFIESPKKEEVKIVTENF